MSHRSTRKEAAVNWNAWVRQAHRWVSIFFTLTVIANIAVMSLRGGKAPPWLTYLPLFPLALLLFSGLYLFVLPYRAKRRRGE
jgi:hypothetical protein